MAKFQPLQYQNALTEAEKKALEQRGYKVLNKYVHTDPVTGEILEEGWTMKLKENKK